MTIEQLNQFDDEIQKLRLNSFLKSCTGTGNVLLGPRDPDDDEDNEEWDDEDDEDEDDVFGDEDDDNDIEDE